MPNNFKAYNQRALYLIFENPENVLRSLDKLLNETSKKIKFNQI
jgi:hypothetical protein